MTTRSTSMSSEVIHPQPHPSVETAFLAPEVVLFDDRHGEIHHLNGPASAVWLMLDGEFSVTDVAIELSDIFSVPEAAMLTDVESIVGDFRDLGLLDGAERPVDESADRDRELPHRIEFVGRPPDT
jgi:hypothetical protein